MTYSRQTLRLLDAAENRAREALRVLEDFVRFELGNHFFTSSLKKIRHSLRDATKHLSTEDRLSSRNTRGDVGTNLVTDSELSRTCLQDIVSANFSRLFESLRTLEEYSKLEDQDASRIFEQLRYESYTLQKVIFASRISHNKLQARLDNSLLYVLLSLDGFSNPKRFRCQLEEICDAGVDVIQLRDKRMSDRLLWEAAKLIREVTLQREVLFVINDRFDIAQSVDADGVHVGQTELPVQAIRDIVGDKMFIGVSTHCRLDWESAVLDGADYLGAGPVFPSQTKTFDSFPGLSYLAEIGETSHTPTFAIGGISEELLPKVFETGVFRIAVSAKSPVVLASMRHKLDRNLEQRKLEEDL